MWWRDIEKAKNYRQDWSCVFEFLTVREKQKKLGMEAAEEKRREDKMWYLYHVTRVLKNLIAKNPQEGSNLRSVNQSIRRKPLSHWLVTSKSYINIYIYWFSLSMKLLYKKWKMFKWEKNFGEIFLREGKRQLGKDNLRLQKNK